MNYRFLLLLPFILIINQQVCSQQTPDIPLFDISGEYDRHVIITEGTKSIYQGHQTSVMLADGKSMFCVWGIERGGASGSMAVSRDGGLTWVRMEDELPAGLRKGINYPGIYRMISMKTGKVLLWVFTSHPDKPRIVSEDGGRTWSEMPQLGFNLEKTFSSIVRLSDGNYMGFFDRKKGENLVVMQTKTDDGGITWSEPEIIADIEGKKPCEPFVFRSPNNKELCCIMSETTHKGGSLMMFSRDEGRTWSQPEDTPWGLTGDKHQGVYTKDGRLVIAFRDMALNSPALGHFVAWVGSYEDIKKKNAGEYRIKLLHSFAGSDCGYPGLEILHDGTIVAITHIKYRDDKNKQSVVSVRFRIQDIDRMEACYMADRGRMKQVPAFFSLHTLFKPKEGEVKVRIPNIVVAGDGTILAFAEGASRLKKSKDNGKSWSEEEDLTLQGITGGQNIVVDDVTGDILILAPGKNTESFLYRSHDYGNTWIKEPILISPNSAGHGGSPGEVPILVEAMSTGITLKHGQHNGRLIIPGRVQPPAGNNAQEYWMYNYNTSIYSDDRGKTWQVSSGIMSGTGEGTLAELSDGRIYYNSRSHMAIDHKRQIAWSHDGGNMYVDWNSSDELYEIGEPFYYKYGSKPGYGICAGLVRVPDGVTDADDILLYSSPDWKGGWRYGMTVWASFNGSCTWPIRRLIDVGPGAYSSLAAGKDGNIYLLYEGGNKYLYDEINIAVFNLKYLVEGEEY